MPRKKTNPNNNVSGGDTELRMVIAWRIYDERRKKYGGFGGGKKCAKALKVSGSCLSHWERGNRALDNVQLKKIAKLFGVGVKYMRTPPEDWETIYPQWIQEIQSKPKIDEDNEPQDEPSHDEPEQPAERPSNTDIATGDKGIALLGESPAPRIILQMMQADKMHDHGKIPSQLFNYVMESINEQLVKLLDSPQKSK